jgi:hypothetical protein
MSASGQKRTCGLAGGMSALGHEAPVKQSAIVG